MTRSPSRSRFRGDARTWAAARRFEPPFCPNEDCSAHDERARQNGWAPQRRGGRAVPSRRTVVWRFLCPRCRRSFSSSLFGPDYRCRKHGLAFRLLAPLCEGQSERQAARTLGVSPTAVHRRRRHLGRQALLIHLETLRRVPLRDLARAELDGLRTFAGSQFEPLDLHTLLWSAPGLVLDLDPAPLRRSGRMTARQREERTAREGVLGKPSPAARRESVEALLRRLAERLPEGISFELATDEEPDYARALGVLEGRCRVRHVTVSSKARRESPGHPLWQTNHLHRLWRHGRADHKRETLSFSKKLQGLMERAWLTVIWRNLVKGISERTAERSRTTPAMQVGLAERPLTAEELFVRRRFPKLVGLPDGYRPFYEGRLKARPNEKIAA